jgi:uncharacterized protein YuzE
MRVRYFTDTDTLFMEISDAASVETREIDDNTFFDLDAYGKVCAITIEHASERTGAPAFSYEHVDALVSAAPQA